MNENRDLNQRENGINPSELSGKGDYYFSNGVQERTPRTTPVGTKRKPAKKGNGVKSTYVFFIVVIVVSILLSSVLFSFVEVTNTFARMGLHLLLLPVIVSITYELNRLVGKYDNPFTRIMTAPGLWLQNWTTFEPDDSMIEVGIRAFTLVLPEEKGKDEW